MSSPESRCQRSDLTSETELVENSLHFMGNNTVEQNQDSTGSLLLFDQI